LRSALALLGRAVARVEDGLLAALGLGLLLAAGAQLGFRLVGGGPAWLDLAMRTATLWIALLGALVATREGRQLHIDALVVRLRGWPAHLVRGVVALFTAGVCVLLAYASLMLVELERAGDAVLFLNIPNWLALAILPVVFALMALHALAQLFVPPSAKDAA
jgi:TRAP-type C4-dicarboxylate transport system permease small subunit